MPNRTGGKNYKKSKQTGSISKPFLDRQPDQQYGRILRNLGGRNMLVYCNDNKIRLCHICGAMKKFNWLSVGDLVLISLRDFEKKPEAGSKEYEKGDILAKYDSDHLGKLKKMPDANPKLFMQLETMDGNVLAAIGEKEAKEQSKMKLQGEDDDCGIEFDRGNEDDEESGEDSDSGKPKVEKGNKPVKTNKAAAATQQDRQTEEDDVNIDDI
jgi:translation initiation factor 1A